MFCAGNVNFATFVTRVKTSNIEYIMICPTVTGGSVKDVHNNMNQILSNLKLYID